MYFSDKLCWQYTKNCSMKEFGANLDRVRKSMQGDKKFLELYGPHYKKNTIVCFKRKIVIIYMYFLMAPLEKTLSAKTISTGGNGQI